MSGNGSFRTSEATDVSDFRDAIFPHVARKKTDKINGTDEIFRA